MIAKRTTFWATMLALLILQACAASRPTVTLSEDPQVNAFLGTIQQHLEKHEWSDIIDLADPDHFETQVTGMGMETVQYVAELFNLYTVGNTIQTGDMLAWEDLDRIESVQLQRLTESMETLQVSGTVTLSNQEVLALVFEIVERNGEYRLTGAVG